MDRKHDNADAAPQIRMRGLCGELITTVDAWHEFLEIANNHQWNSEHPCSLYRADIGLEVTGTDARNLGKALQRALRELLLNETRVSCPTIRQTVAEISELVAFCHDGPFRIC